MKFYNLIIAFVLLLGLNSCWIGDQDDPEILYEPTIIEVLCQTPELSTYCELVYLTPLVTTGAGAGLVPQTAWLLQFSGRTIIDGKACPRKVETVFAPTNDAFETFLADYPQWPTIYDIPQDTVALITAAHIYTDAKLINQLGDDPDCNAEELIGGSTPYDMVVGQWIFLENAQGDFIAASLTGGGQTLTPIISPDYSTTDGIIYVVHDVLAPF